MYRGMPRYIYSVDLLTFFSSPLLHHLQCWYSLDPHLLNRERGYTVRKIDRFLRLTMSVEVGQECGCKHIPSTCRIDLVGAIGREAFGDATSEEGSPVSSVSGNEEGDVHAPTSQYGIGLGAVAFSEGEQVVVAKNEHVE